MTLRTLKVTSPLISGPDVEYFQELLYSIGYNVGIDGIYGNKSADACRKFQKENKLIIDGVCGPKTWEAIEKMAENKKPDPTPDLDVNVDERLSVWGFDSLIKEKGKDTAIRQFQAALSFTVDGKVGPITAAALNSEPIVPRISETMMKCQCPGYCNGYPNGHTTIGVRILAERIFREVEKKYPGTQFAIPTRSTPNSGGAIAGGYRCERWNKERGGAAGSQHRNGMGMDIYGRRDGTKESEIRKYIEDTAMQMNKSGGVGYGAQFIVHIDTRGVPSRWKY